MVRLKELMMLTVVGLLVSCGGSNPSAGNKPASDGRVYVTNETNAQLRVSYLDEELGEFAVDIEPHEVRKEVSARVLPANSEVTFRILGRSFSGSPTADVKIKIDGDVLIRVTHLGFGAPIEYEVTGG